MASEEEKNLEIISGTVENVIYENKDNGYTVFDLSNDDGGDDIITVCGIMPDTKVGERVKVAGEWIFSRNYGRQFKAAYFEKKLPATEQEILRYLSGRAVKGIGPRTAEKLVEQYGEDTLDVIENHPEWVARLPGISASKAAAISEAFKSQFGVRNLMLFCREYLSPAVTMKIYKKWGASALDRLKRNPYELCEEFRGIGFEKADRLAMAVGIGADSEFRISSGVIYVLNVMARTNGHAFLPYDKLVSLSSQVLGVKPEKTKSVIEEMIADNRLVRCEIEGLDAVYTGTSFRIEKEIAERLAQIERACPGMGIGDAERFIDSIEIEEKKHYAALQRLAISSAANSGVMILTGGPGTGKTTVIRAVIGIFRSLGMKIALAAPTGRAAKRMSEATHTEAKTIHRLLEMEFDGEPGESFRRNEGNPLDEDAVIIDEASMIDMYLMASLLRAVKPGAHLMLIGDSDQLPSVGAGNVLNDIIASEKFCTVKLTEIFRQAKESLIITNAHRINNGEYPVLNCKDNDFFFLPRNGDNSIVGTMVDLCVNRLPKTYGKKAVEGLQIISPSRKGAAGTENLNRMLQNALNPPSKGKREKKFRDVVFREGDRVMQIKNDYDIAWEKDGKSGQGVFNGDIGIIETVNESGGCMVISFDDRVVNYEYERLEELDHAYAITVHKSQGSEYPIVVMPMSRSCPEQLLSRNLFYTAVTRAENMVVIVGETSVVAKMVDNNRQVMRYTGLLRH